MKRKIIQGITLLVFASLVTAFIVYRVQASNKITTKEKHAAKNDAELIEPVKTDSLVSEDYAAVSVEKKIHVQRRKETPYPYVDTENTEVSGFLKGKDVLPKTEYINLSGDSAVEEVEYEMPVMSGSKTMIVKDWKFDFFKEKQPVDFSKTLTKKRK